MPFQGEITRIACRRAGGFIAKKRGLIDLPPTWSDDYFSSFNWCNACLPVVAVARRHISEALSRKPSLTATFKFDLWRDRRYFGTISIS
ncbi:hypothetical protein MFFC18_16650 [Mariniblastus fucicola]|uniref:Uncharacterized protein n=1 Tax=Mariniblastus fucicola TaxID=980251 RepID=A0A5B9PBB6_9BACT|nr:hypothetical protein MFFC18_16650 [Mariniblastus fucicola]